MKRPRRAASRIGGVIDGEFARLGCYLRGRTFELVAAVDEAIAEETAEAAGALSQGANVLRELAEGCSTVSRRAAEAARRSRGRKA